MLGIFRKYQRFLFMIVTVVVIISFSFFGTGDATTSSSPADRVEFTTASGTPVSALEMEHMTRFLSTDAQDKILSGGIWGPNFLNEGIVQNIILSSGLGPLLMESQWDYFSPEMEKAHKREARAELYTHPYSSFLSAETVWRDLAPNLAQRYEAYRRALRKDFSAASLEAKVDLYLAERAFPPELLRNVLLRREQQYSWLPADKGLRYGDVSLFSYGGHLENWFGPRFVRSAARFIFEGAELSQAKGYEVSTEEAAAELWLAAERSFYQMRQKAGFSVPSVKEYMGEQLRIMGMDHATATRIVQKVLLFQRLFDDTANAVILDSLAFRQFQNYAKEGLEADVYRLPKSLQFDSFRDLQLFQTYLEAVSNQDPASLDLPSTFKSVTDLEKVYPELVERRYQIEAASVSKQDLQVRVTVRQLSDWQLEPQNWATLQDEFSQLSVSKAQSRDERFRFLENLDPQTRAEVDVYSKAEIVEAHPEWLTEALDKRPGSEFIIGILSKGQVPLKGVSKSEEIQALFDGASLRDDLEASESEKAANEKLAFYSQDGENFYRIRVVAKGGEKQILTFAEAHQAGILDSILESRLEKEYAKLKESKPDAFKDPDGQWKTLRSVRDEIATEVFQPILREIHKDFAKARPDEERPAKAEPAFCSSLRFFRHLRAQKAALEAGQSPEGIVGPAKANTKPALTKDGLAEQWLLVHSQEKALRSQPGALGHRGLLEMEDQSWSEVFNSPTGNTYFVFAKSWLSEEGPVKSQLEAGRTVLAKWAKKDLAKVILESAFPTESKL